MPVFLFRGKFRKGLLECREVENWVVPETAHSVRAFQNFTIYAIRRYCDDASLLCERNRADEMRDAITSTFFTHLTQQLLDALRVCSSGPSVARGLNPWCSV